MKFICFASALLTMVLEHHSVAAIKVTGDEPVEWITDLS